MTAPITIAIVLASTSAAGAGAHIAAWFERAAAPREGVKLDPVRVDAVPGAFAEAIEGADAVVIVTPEYNHSFPGELKVAIDRLRREWYATPVGFVTYGGISGGLRAAEALRVVFGELHAVTIRETISFAYPERAFDAVGAPRDRDAVESALTRFLDVLGWWARALREAQANEPYPA